METVRGRGYLGLAAGLQLVFVAAQPLVVEADVLGQRSDLLQPHLLRERALNAVALVDHFALAQQTNKTFTNFSFSFVREKRNLGRLDLQGTRAERLCVWESCSTCPLR